ncbi:phosphatase PAP2 family protein [Pseudochrobactrum sp. HB0163]|uniref:phosphatase PAP2 family protein n=1 Tax=Pseudochrobactrum sp. HB0163 TaxID=3450708 RepID=UPI003F6DE30D
MFLKKEIADLYLVVQNSLALRRLKQAENRQNPLWLPAMTRMVIGVIVAALLLLPFDGQISRAAVAAHILPRHILKIMTDLVLAAPYIILFSVTVIAALIMRNRIRKTNIYSKSYQYWADIAGYSLFAILSLLSAGLIVNIVKYIIGRPRPVLLDIAGPYALKPFDFTYAYVSFPSGHACTAGVLATLLALWFPRCRFVACAVFAAIACIRILVQAHYPTDVLIGFFIGMCTTLILARGFAQGGLLYRFYGSQIFPVRH